MVLWRNMASVMTLLAFLALATPALVGFFRQALGWRTVGFYCVIGVALLASNIGFRVGPLSDAASLAKAPAVGQPVSTRCEEALAVAERGGIVRGRSANRLEVNRDVWSTLPEELRTALVQCAESVLPPERRGEPVEVVERPS